MNLEYLIDKEEILRDKKKKLKRDLIGTLIIKQYEEYILNELGKLYLRRYKKEIRGRTKKSNEIGGINYLVEHPELLEEIVNSRKQGLTDVGISRRIFDLENYNLYFALNYLGEYSLAKEVKKIQELRAYRREYNRKHYQKHKEELKEYIRRYRQEHKDEFREYKKKYYQKHKEELKEYSRKRYQKHKDEIREQQRRYRKHKKELQ